MKQMSDLVKRLRTWEGDSETVEEAANRIEALESVIKSLAEIGCCWRSNLLTDKINNLNPLQKDEDNG
jgi:hypothetical protein